MVNKNVNLNLRVSEEVKGMAARRAAEEYRSVTSYVEMLIRRDSDRADNRKQPVRDAA